MHRPLARIQITSFSAREQPPTRRPTKVLFLAKPDRFETPSTSSTGARATDRRGACTTHQPRWAGGRGGPGSTAGAKAPKYARGPRSHTQEIARSFWSYFLWRFKPVLCLDYLLQTPAWFEGNLNHLGCHHATRKKRV
jgi:hypothetical protein